MWSTRITAEWTHIFNGHCNGAQKQVQGTLKRIVLDLNKFRGSGCTTFE